jgi:hypothetical protein
MKKLFYLLILSAQFNDMSGQTTTTIAPTRPIHSISLGIGISHTVMKNETLSPLIFSGTDVPFHLTYRRESAVSKQYIQFLYQAQNLKSPFGLTSEEQGGHLLYGYLRKLKSYEKAAIYLGGEMHINGVYRNMPVNPNNDFLTILNSLNISGSMDYQLGKHHLEAQINLTVLGYNMRRGNNLSDDIGNGVTDALWANTRFETLPKYVNTALRLTYFVPTNAKHIRWRFDYLGNYYGFTQQQYFGVLQNQLTTSFTYQF